jgi:hypothetical protein
VPGGDVGVHHGLRAVPVPVEDELVRALHVDDTAVLGDDGGRDAEELTECDGVGEGLPRGDDDRCLLGPRPERVHDAGVE